MVKKTIYDIARLAGASPSTVSAALSDKWKSRRISPARVKEIRRIAKEQGYAANMQARGLRKSRSGLAGLLIPEHENRYFNALASAFERQAEARGLVPLIASTRRDSAREIHLAETFSAYAIEFLLIAGAQNAAALGKACKAHRLRHVFVDLPGPGAPSVISDNFLGAKKLTEELLKSAAPSEIIFIGGAPDDHATQARSAGFREALREAGSEAGENQFRPCGYAPEAARAAIAEILHERALPRGLFINSVSALEGALRHFITLPAGAFADCAIGCYDYDPFAAWLRFPLHMVRQDADGLIAKACELILSGNTAPSVHQVSPLLIPPRTIFNREAAPEFRLSAPSPD